MNSWDVLIDAANKSEKYRRLGSDSISQIQMLITSSLANVDASNAYEIRAQCPFHTSDGGVSQTLRINLDSTHSLGIGFFKCYSCGKKGHFNDLAEQMGVDPIIGEANPELRNVMIPLRKESFEYRGAPSSSLLDLPVGFFWDRPKDNVKITIRALNIVKAKLWHMRMPVWKVDDKRKLIFDKDGNKILDFFHPEIRIWMPVYDRDQVVAHVAALIGKRHWWSKKYLNSKGSWPKKYLWPLEQVMRSMHERRFIVIVEGPADALRLIDNGIPAIANLGVGAWTADKAQIIAAHYDRVVVCMDADSAGLAAQLEIVKTFEDLLPVQQIPLKPGKDPASVSQATIDKLKQIITRG
jgi:5S rRNA maturation endonuclease (ribonuclease M5)